MDQVQLSFINDEKHPLNPVEGLLGIYPVKIVYIFNDQIVCMQCKLYSIIPITIPQPSKTSSLCLETKAPESVSRIFLLCLNFPF